MKEYLLSTNNFGEPRVLDENDARGINLLRLLLMTQGHNPLFPKMGCNLTLYKHIPSDEVPTLETTITEQVNNYLPECLADTVELSVSTNNYLIINITCKDVKYIFNSEDTSYPITLDQIY
jgi:hypothetical protein